MMDSIRGFFIIVEAFSKILRPLIWSHSKLGVKRIKTKWKILFESHASERCLKIIKRHPLSIIWKVDSNELSKYVKGYAKEKLMVTIKDMRQKKEKEKASMKNVGTFLFSYQLYRLSLLLLTMHMMVIT